ncbi:MULTISPECIES: hypothetical protein [unclassified Neisseria]|uniref:hypothetical protein n=1 Tax=unclassified Neisseria TaxID=2623750 RepID=UPI0026670A88|nr:MULTISPECIES: hypothetical protein [unclassified Neisseria]MDO1516081.1 hypothetical protein [Neisseria sp. MVDL18-041461]MDO1563196.1 hypothetical protein [Neisseria sp. MVDL20-010259]
MVLEIVIAGLILYAIIHVHRKKGTKYILKEWFGYPLLGICIGFILSVVIWYFVNL